MIDYTIRAAGHIAALLDDYDDKERPPVMRSLQRALREAWAAIEANPAEGLAAPRPSPHLARLGVLWIHSGSYWVAWRRSLRVGPHRLRRPPQTRRRFVGRSGINGVRDN